MALGRRLRQLGTALAQGTLVSYVEPGMARAPLRRCLLLAVASALAMSIVAPAEGFAAAYRGKTSQRLPISFTLSGSHLINLSFRIDDVCPDHHVWRIHDFGFHAITISRSRFDEKFVSALTKATAVVKGRFFAKSVSGRLLDRRYISREHRYCRGIASFHLRRRDQL